MSGWRWLPERRKGPVDDAFVQQRWVRPYRPGFPRVALSVSVAVVAVGVVYVGLLSSLSLANGLARLVGCVLTGVVAGVLGWFAGRLLLAGVWVNDRGVRFVRLASIVALPWSEVAAVEAVDGVLWLHLRHAAPLRAPITARGLDFLGREEAWDMASLAVQRWHEETPR